MNPLLQLCLRVDDVDAWHAWVKSCGVANLTEAKDSPSLKIRAFMFDDPEGYQIEIQTPLA